MRQTCLGCGLRGSGARTLHVLPEDLSQEPVAPFASGEGGVVGSGRGCRPPGRGRRPWRASSLPGPGHHRQHREGTWCCSISPGLCSAAGRQPGAHHGGVHVARPGARDEPVGGRRRGRHRRLR
ncbi:hypothetical protein LV779_18305 [Streptomyces thinghirensis]|nr:hypothetical protein [Streptomyces thinghirensis]